MLYNTATAVDKENFLARAQLLASRGDVVELSAKRKRSRKQSAYLHSLFSYFGCIYGESAEYIKNEYFKLLVNPDVFITSAEKDRLTGKIKFRLRSTADLSMEEMSTCIDRFRNWSAKEAGIYLPLSTERDKLDYCELEIARTSKFL